MASPHKASFSRIFNPYCPSYFRRSPTNCNRRAFISCSSHFITANPTQHLANRQYGNIDGVFPCRIHFSRLPELCSVRRVCAYRKIRSDQLSFYCPAACRRKKSPGGTGAAWCPRIIPARPKRGEEAFTQQDVDDVRSNWVGMWGLDA